jgi:hypothetical protein
VAKVNQAPNGAVILHHINYGLALACTTFLVYSSFAQRSLIMMGAGTANPQIST